MSGANALSLLGGGSAATPAAPAERPDAPGSKSHAAAGLEQDATSESLLMHRRRTIHPRRQRAPLRPHLDGRTRRRSESEPVKHTRLSPIMEEAEEEEVSRPRANTRA